MIEKLKKALSNRDISSFESEKTDVYRLLCDGEEGLKGLIVDRYGASLLLNVLDARCFLSGEELKKIGEFYLQALPLEAVYLKRLGVDRSHKLPAKEFYENTPFLGRTRLTPWIVQERGVKFQVSHSMGYASGFYLDQRENRRVLAEHSKGKRILNTFSYTCSFSVVCARAGATVDSVDLSKKALEWGKENFRLNDLSLDGHRFFARDVFEFLQQTVEKKWNYDLVILDPPSFSRSKGGRVFSITKDLDELVQLAGSVVAPGGRLFLSTNYRGEAGFKIESCGLQALKGSWSRIDSPELSSDVNKGRSIVSIYLERET